MLYSVQLLYSAVMNFYMWNQSSSKHFFELYKEKELRSSPITAYHFTAVKHSNCIVFLCNISSHHSSKSCANPYFIEKWRCLSSVSLFFCRKALGLLTSSPLPSFLLSEGTHLKNENKVIVPVLFLKSLQMLSVDGRLIVRRVAVRAAGRGAQVQVQQQQLQQQHFSQQHHRKHTLLHSTGKFHTAAAH